MTDEQPTCPEHGSPLAEETLGDNCIHRTYECGCSTSEEILTYAIYGGPADGGVTPVPPTAVGQRAMISLGMGNGWLAMYIADPDSARLDFAGYATDVDPADLPPMPQS